MAGPAYHGRTHLPGGTDPIPGLTLGSGGPGVEDLILAESPVGLWKLNETSGTTAADSSGNGNHMTVPANYQAPTWGQIVAPPTTTSARFVPWAGIDEGSRLSVALPAALTDDFSAGMWVNLDAFDTSRLIGQGTQGGANAWSIWFDSGGANEKFAVYMGGTAIRTNNDVLIDTWYLLGFTRESGTTTMYLNGLAQTATTAASPGTSSTSTWLGDDGVGAGSSDAKNTLMSWAFITDQPISGADWLAIYEAGQTGGALAEGLVWTSDGAGGASWEPPTIEVTY